MPESHSPATNAAQLPASAGSASLSAGQVKRGSVAGPGTIPRAALLRAMTTALLLVLGCGALVGLVLYGGTELLAADTRVYYALGLGAAAAAAIGTVWLHGRFAATPAPTIAPGGSTVLVTGRLQSLLAAAFGVKLCVLVLGVLAIKQFPLGEEPAKFSQVATFAVTFAAGALLCQLATAAVLARALRRPSGSVPSSQVDPRS